MIMKIPIITVCKIHNEDTAIIIDSPVVVTVVVVVDITAVVISVTVMVISITVSC